MRDGSRVYVRLSYYLVGVRVVSRVSLRRAEGSYVVRG